MNDKIYIERRGTSTSTNSYTRTESDLRYSSTGHTHEEFTPVGGTINRTDGMISSIDLASGITVSIARNEAGSIATINNETYTWTFIRDEEGSIISWTVT